MIFAPLDQHDPRLRQVCAEVSKAQLRDREQQLELEALLDFVYGVVNKDLRGVLRDRSRPNTAGVSGNQLGIMKRICAVDLSVGRRGYTDMYLLINPTLSWHSKAVTEKLEGCVNFPTTWGITRRFKTVRVSAWDRSGNELELALTGWPAILMQHEIDHLQGRLFIDRLIDPVHAHSVSREDYPRYRKVKPEQWDQFIDVSSELP